MTNQAPNKNLRPFITIKVYDERTNRLLDQMNVNIHSHSDLQILKDNLEVDYDRKLKIKVI